MATIINTAPYTGVLGEGRSVVVTKRNIYKVNEWLGSQGDLLWGNDKKTKGSIPKFTIRTKKGIRVAVVGDTIVRFGNKRGFSDHPVSYAVVKAA